MASYKIDISADGKTSYYHVRKALGPWPLANWSLQPVYTTTSHGDAQRWIRETQFTESAEGRALALAEERAKEERRQQWLQEKAAMERAGMTWCVEAACFVDSAGRIVPE